MASAKSTKDFLLKLKTTLVVVRCIDRQESLSRNWHCVQVVVGEKGSGAYVGSGQPDGSSGEITVKQAWTAERKA